MNRSAARLAANRPLHRSAGFLACLGESHQREVTKRRHGAAFHQTHAVRPLGPAREPFPGKLRAPAQPERHRRKGALEGATQARLRADTADQYDLAAWLEHAREFIKRGLGMG